jgi:hypothetical protein
MKRLGLIIGALLALMTVPAAAEVPQPDIVIANKDSKCIAPLGEMRRNHMKMLKHQRELTLREGILGAKVSLRGCIECHANKTNDSVIGSDKNFCQTCHDYVAVKLDCWECHQPKANYQATGAMPHD